MLLSDHWVMEECMQVLLLVLTVLMVDGVVYLFNIVQTWV